MFARRVIDVRTEVWSAPLPYLDGPIGRLFLSTSAVNLKLIANPADWIKRHERCTFYLENCFALVLSKYSRLLPICHGFWTPLVAYYLRWRDRPHLVVVT